MSDRVLERLHGALVEALRSRGADFGAPVSVSEIAEELIPYRAARSLIGFELNADYEHALMRLLAGEGEYALLEPEDVRLKLKHELESANPDVGLFRKFSGCSVFIAPEAGNFVPRTVAAEPEPAPQAEASAPPAAEAAASAEEIRTCTECGGALPAGRPVFFCPHCGRNLAAPRCAHCGAQLESGWRYCANCGAATART